MYDRHRSGHGRADVTDCLAHELLDWLGLDGEDAFLKSSISGASHSLDLGVAGPSWARGIRGDPRVLRVGDGEAPEQASGLVRVLDTGDLEWIWQSQPGELRFIRHAERTSDGFAVWAQRGPTPQPEPADLLRIEIDESGQAESRVVLEDARKPWIMHRDPDEYVDLSYTKNGQHYFRFGRPDGSFTSPQRPPVNWKKTGIHQSFDLDANGGIDVLLTYEADGGRTDWKMLSFEPCE